MSKIQKSIANNLNLFAKKEIILISFIALNSFKVTFLDIMFTF